MKKNDAGIILMTIFTDEDTLKFCNMLSKMLNDGFEIENCGVNSCNPALAWAILSHP